jgi:hypothetical protein
MPGPKLTVEGVRRAIQEYDQLGRPDFLAKYGYGQAQEYFIDLNGQRYDSKAIAGVAHGFVDRSKGPLSPKQFSGGEAAVGRRLRRLGFKVVRDSTGDADGEHPNVALPLRLHGETNRKEAYELFGIKFDQRQRQLIKGLSPRLRDGGYFIWITLDKTDFDENYDYEDRLDLTSFTWVTQRGVRETDSDYQWLQNHRTRVSLFVRPKPNEEFTYLGEMQHHSHEQFTAANGRPQMRFLFQLDHPVPEEVLDRLYQGIGVSQTSQRAERPQTPVAARPRTRRPTTFGQAREALAYVLGDVQRVFVPAHHNYQVRLQQFLTQRGIDAEWERDFVDVRFTAAGRLFIGEIKVTSYLTLDEAFRTAIGQLLFYGHLQFDLLPGLVMLLDRSPDAKRIAMATRLGISIVVEEEIGAFKLLSQAQAPELHTIFLDAESR